LSEKVVLRSSTDLPWKLVHPTGYKFEVFRQREQLILERRLKSIERMTAAEAKDYKLFFMLLSSIFQTSVANRGDDYKPWVFDWGNGLDGQRLFRRGTSWLTWFVLHEGPDLFWQQWWTLPPESPETKNYIRDKSLEAWFGDAKITPEEFIRQFSPKAWHDVNEKCHSIQRNHAQQVHEAIDKRVNSGSDYSALSPIPYFTRYAELRQWRRDAGLAPVRETLSHVPFYVEFRCPEELFQKFCSSRQERASAIASPRTE
jgi:hypothetical protein